MPKIWSEPDPDEQASGAEDGPAPDLDLGQSPGIQASVGDQDLPEDNPTEGGDLDEV